MKHIVTIAAALALAAVPGTGAAQTVKPISGAAVVKVTPDRIAAAARRAQRPTPLAKVALAVTAQKVLGLSAQPAVGEAVVLDASQMLVGTTMIWFEQVTYGSYGASPVVALGQDGAKSRINISYSAGAKPSLVDCDFQLAVTPNSSMNSSFMVYRNDGSATPIYSGTSQIGMDGHLVLAVPAVAGAAGAKLLLQINMPTFAGSTDFAVINACRLYQLG